MSVVLHSAPKFALPDAAALGAVESNGEVILTSEMYEAKTGAQTGIESVKANASNDQRYERKASAKGEPWRQTDR